MKRISRYKVIGLTSLALYSCESKKSSTSTGNHLMNGLPSEALFNAATGNDDSTIVSLVSKAVDLSSINGEGNSALHLAAQNNALDAVKTLVQNGAPIDLRNPNGRTPLMMATNSGHIEIIQYLLRQNASPDIKDNRGFRAITMAAEAGNNEVVETLALYSRNHLDDALFIASLRGHSEMIDTLTNYGASVYSRIEKDGRTPLMMAAQNGHQETVRILLENGANRYSTDEAGLTASELANVAGHQKIATYLAKTPQKDEFRIADSNDSGLKTAVQKVVAVEKRAQGATLRANETPLAVEKIKVIALNGRTLHTAPEKSIAETLTFKTYREESLPIKVLGVTDKKISIKYLYGHHNKLDIYPGEMIPETNLEVISAKAKRDHSKMTATGKPADVSKVMVKDTSTGVKREMTTGLNVGRTEPFAIIKEYKSNSLLVAKKGDLFKKSDGTEYEVLEVRSTQLVLMNSDTGLVHTIKK